MAMMIALGSGVCQAQGFGVRSEEYLRIEWEVGQASGERSTISGYIYNDHDLWAAAIQLLVEELDASGRVVRKSVGYVDSWVRPSDRAYFEVAVSSTAASYRVGVHSTDWFEPGASTP
ncbi:MAG: hypothetical protein ACE5JN_02000 [Candidatus Methylomirabilia bacterium]